MNIFRLTPLNLVSVCSMAAFCGLAVGVQTAHAQTFVNGGFEAPVRAVGWVDEFEPTGWVTDLGGADEWPYSLRNDGDTTNEYTPYGDQFLVLCARDCSPGDRGSISQAISGFVVGAQYTLNFWQSPEVHSSPPIPGEDNIVNVSIAGGTPASTDFSAQSVGVIGRDFADWKAQSLVFTANATSLTFTFAGVANVNSDTESGIDNISLSVGGSSAAIPTMSAYGLALTVLGLLLVATRRLSASGKRR